MSLINTLIRNVNAIGHLSTQSVRCLSRTAISYELDSTSQIITLDNLLELQESVRTLNDQVALLQKNIDMVEYKLIISESKFRYSYVPKLGQLWTAHTLSELRNSKK